MDIINIFQERMKEMEFDAYIIPTSDFHSSEYVSDYFKGRKYLSGFTGSAGTLVITQDNAYLWTDGRYYIQAAKQIEGRPIVLMKQGQPDVPLMEDFICEYMHDKHKLAFDGRVMSTNTVLKLKGNLPDGVELITNIDLVDAVWTSRPKLPFSQLFELNKFFCGKTYQEKLDDIKNEMKTLGSDAYIISALEDQAWLYNLRANDVLNTPVFLAFTLITDDHTILFIDQKKLKSSIIKYLDKNQIIVKPYNEIYDAIKTLKNRKIVMDMNKVNYQIYSNICNNNIVTHHTDITLLMKAIKNETELKNTKLAHIKDGVAVTKFMYYLKNNFKNDVDMTEISVSDYLEELRRKNEGFVELSFDTICAFNDHAAMMHYFATDETNAQIKGPGLLLVDSGAHYLEGTTDITRTFALGKISDQMKVHFTTILKSVIALSTAVFLKGCNGQNLDILARGPVWKLLIDYKCGTGHGVGHILSVHEAPNGFRWKIVPERNDSAVFQPGMITTNEPGIYLEGKYGIRTENEMVCVEKGSTEFGDFLGFETITFAPIDLDAIKPSLLTRSEKDWLNSYHEEVFKTISPYLEPEEIEWLKEYTKKI